MRKIFQKADHRGFDVFWRCCHRPGIKGRFRGIFTHKLRAFRIGPVSELGHHGKAEIKSGCNASSCDPVAITDNTRIDRCCAEIGQYMPHRPMGGEVALLTVQQPRGAENE